MSVKYQCHWCNMVVEIQPGTGAPDKKYGGPCTRNSKGEHGWHVII